MRNKLLSLHGLIKEFGIIIKPEELEKAINDESDKILWRIRLIRDRGNLSLCSHI